jgi:TonB family protein
MKRVFSRRGRSTRSVFLLLLTLVVCALPVCGQRLDSRSFDTGGVEGPQASRGAGTDAQGWVRVAPVGEEFTVMMPHPSRLSPDTSGAVSFYQSIHSYGSSDDSDTYIVTSSPRAGGASMEAMLNPISGEYEHQTFKDLRRRGYGIEVIEKRDLTLKGYTGREYHLSISIATAFVTRVYVTRRRVYTLLWIRNYESGPAGQIARERFFDSFMFGPINNDKAASNVYTGDEQADNVGLGIGPGCGGPGCTGTGRGGWTGGGVGVGGGGSGLPVNDPNRIFSPREVTQKARILSKPEPIYTTEARQNNVSGTVILKVVLAADAVVRNIRVVSGLPFGLTERAVAAARQIKFAPAMRDGRPVAQLVVIEYNFNPY